MRNTYNWEVAYSASTTRNVEVYIWTYKHHLSKTRENLKILKSCRMSNLILLDWWKIFISFNINMRFGSKKITFMTHFSEAHWKWFLSYETSLYCFLAFYYDVRKFFLIWDIYLNQCNIVQKKALYVITSRF